MFKNSWTKFHRVRQGIELFSLLLVKALNSSTFRTKFAVNENCLFVLIPKEKQYKKTKKKKKKRKKKDLYIFHFPADKDDIHALASL
jgi:hypothetical protein